MNKVAELFPVLTFLEQIKANNNKVWFEENQTSYRLAQTEFATFIGQVIAELRPQEDWGNLTAKSCIFRLHRDVRFAKDKSPYQTHMSAAIGPQGKKSSLPYYLQLAPQGQSFLGGGLYMPSSAQLTQLREAIADDARGLKAITQAKSFRHYFGELRGDRLKVAPQGYTKDHPEIELLRFKQILALHPLTDEQVTNADLVPHVVQVFTAMKPLLDYLHAIIGPVGEA
jgi:uncharacterized protein (TIGR02453 family)